MVGKSSPYQKLVFFFLMLQPPSSTLFPYTTLFRSANQVVSVGADIAFDADPKFFACLVRFESKNLGSASKDRKSGSAGMPRPNSYAAFCLKKKTCDTAT